MLVVCCYVLIAHGTVLACVPNAGLLNGDAASLEAATEFFKSEFPRDTPLALISSKRDSIARPEDMKRLFVVATEAREVGMRQAQCVHVLGLPALRSLAVC
jgi:hypothetical protein